MVNLVARPRPVDSAPAETAPVIVDMQKNSVAMKGGIFDLTGFDALQWVYRFGGLGMPRPAIDRVTGGPQTLRRWSPTGLAKNQEGRGG